MILITFPRNFNTNTFYVWVKHHDIVGVDPTTHYGFDLAGRATYVPTMKKYRACGGFGANEISWHDTIDEAKNALVVIWMREINNRKG